MTQDPWLFWTGGGELRGESLALVKKVGDIVQVVKK